MKIARPVQLLMVLGAVQAVADDGLNFFNDKKLSFDSGRSESKTAEEQEHAGSPAEDRGVEGQAEEGAGTQADAPASTGPVPEQQVGSAAAPAATWERAVVTPRMAKEPGKEGRHTPARLPAGRVVVQGVVQGEGGTVEVLRVRELEPGERESMQKWLRCGDPLGAEVRLTGRIRSAVAQVMSIREADVPQPLTWVFGRTGPCFARPPGEGSKVFDLVDNAARRALPIGGGR